jgi:hypothetical protein
VQRLKSAFFYFIPVVAGGILVALMTANSACQGSKEPSAMVESPAAAESPAVPPIDAAQPERIESAAFAYG